MKLFVGFALAMRQDFHHPLVDLITAFVEHLASTQRTAAADLSSISTLCAVLQRHHIPTRNFAANSISPLLRSIKINKRTPAVQRPPIHLRELRLIFAHLSHTHHATQMQVAVLLLFTTSFRQSNLASPTARTFDSSRHLTWADIRLAPSYVQVLEKWSKTRQQISRDRWLAIPRVPGSTLCLHAAITTLLRAMPSARSSQPLLMFDDGGPMLLSFITRAFKEALAWAGLAQRGFTLHSLCRGGAQFLQHSGVNTSHIASKPAAFRALQALK